MVSLLTNNLGCLKWEVKFYKHCHMNTFKIPFVTVEKLCHVQLTKLQ